MNEKPWLQLAIAGLMGLMHTLLMFLLFREERPGKALSRQLPLFLLSVAAQTALRYFEQAEGWTAYLLLTAIYGEELLCIRFRTGTSWSGASQRCLCYCLITETLMLVLSHLSWKFLSADVFRIEPAWRMLLAYIFLFALLYSVLRLIFSLFPPDSSLSPLAVLLGFISTVPFLFVRHITFWLPVAAEEVPPAIILTIVMSCVVAVSMIICLERLLFSEAEKRQAQKQRHIAEMQLQQFNEKRNATDAVRRQYHDMKNLLLYVEKQPSNDNLRAHLNKMLGGMKPIENQIETGNEAFDILLNDKLAVCAEKHISCSILADGHLLDPIAQLDLVTIVGNAMDNAIEACQQLPDSSTPFIQVRTMQKPGFTVLLFRNSCLPDLKASQLRTTKSNPQEHGFGLRNIRRVTEQYGGSMSCTAQNGIFTLSLLFPAKK